MKTLIDKIIPNYAILPLCWLACLQIIIYGGTKLISANFKHHSPAMFIDSHIPFAKGFIFVYVGCYLIWIINYILCAHISQNHFYQFVIAATLGYVICGIIFLIYPTTISRPDVSHLKGLDGLLLNIIYSLDQPVNLFPSMHCLISWYCWIAIRNQNINPVYQIFTLVAALLVCISTVAIKQHFFIDIIAGISLSEITWLLAKYIYGLKQ